MERIRVDGAELAFRERGAGRPVFFIHGTGTYSALFDALLDVLPGDLRAIVYDRRGFGASSGPPARGLADHVTDAAGLIEACVGGPVAVIGSSAGGVLALRLAVEHPELVSSLVLIEPAYQMALTPSVSANLALTRVYVRWLVGRDPAGAARFFYRWATGYRRGGNQFDSYPEEWKQQAIVHAPATLRELAQLMPLAPARRLLTRISAPATVVIGDGGLPVFHRTARRALRALPGALEVRAPGAAHLVYTDEPVICARAITDTIERTS